MEKTITGLGPKANSLHARVYWPFAVGASFADLQLLLKLSPRAKGCNMLNSGDFGHFARKTDLHTNNKDTDQPALTRSLTSAFINRYL